jgi:SAM-dependent methyltransferase
VNKGHLEFLASDGWRQLLEENLLPWVLSVGDLGDDVIEVGPGPGLTTDLLRSRVKHVTAVELDDDLAAALTQRLSGTNVEVVHCDASKTALPSDRFSAATCFSMLHHVPDDATQDAVFAELHRVLRPGGMLVAADAIDVDFIRDGHEDDVFNPLDPATLADRLTSAGFVDPTLELTDYELRFHAHKA